MLQRRRTKLRNPYPIGNDIDSAGRETVVAHDFVAHHRRVSNDASRPALTEQRFFQSQDEIVFAIEAAAHSLQRILKLRSAIKPRLMHAVAGPEEIAMPDALQTDQQITVLGWVSALKLVGESDWVMLTNADDSANGPFLLRPIFGGKKGCLVTGRHQ